MNRVIEIVKSEKNCDKLIVDGYHYTKENRREENFYWKCENWKSLNCKGRAKTLLFGQNNEFVFCTDYNHAPIAACVGIVKVTEQIKNLARNTNELPIQVVQNIRANCPPFISAQRQLVQSVRQREFDKEPDTLENCNLSQEYRMKISGQLFLTRIDVNDDTIFLFTTVLNLRILNRSPFWVMDGTFKTVPLLFRQLINILFMAVFIRIIGQKFSL